MAATASTLPSASPLQALAAWFLGSRPAPLPAPPVAGRALPAGLAARPARPAQRAKPPLRVVQVMEPGSRAGTGRIVISGRTDSVGPEEFNQQLALARAMAVRNFIRDAVPDLPNVIAIDAKGRCCFIASNDDEGGRSRNRRVEVVFTSSGVM